MHGDGRATNRSDGRRPGTGAEPCRIVHGEGPSAERSELPSPPPRSSGAGPGRRATRGRTIGWALAGPHAQIWEERDRKLEAARGRRAAAREAARQQDADGGRCI
jgi:hypothetical protein